MDIGGAVMFLFVITTAFGGVFAVYLDRIAKALEKIAEQVERGK